MKKGGFTLVEIMFVVAILGLLASLGIPAILNALSASEEKVRGAHLTAIEKAKGMLQLPEIIYERGRNLTNNTLYGAGEYSEENLMKCVQNATQIKDLDVGEYRLVPGAIGERASYIKKSLIIASE